MLLFENLSVETDIFKFEKSNFSEFCYIFIKNRQICKEKSLFADTEIFTIVSDIFEHVLNQFSKHMVLLHKHMFPDKRKSNYWLSYVKKVFSKCRDKNQKMLQKNEIYIIIQKVYFQQIRQKAINKILNINFQNTLADISFIY